MKNIVPTTLLLFFILFLYSLISCNGNKNTPSNDAIKAINLKRGAVVVCGPPEKQLGSVGFKLSGSEKEQDDFDLAVALLHSFEYDEAEKVFAKIIDAAPGCAMAYWGVAMCNYHPLWTPPTVAELEKGNKAIVIAQSLPQKSKKEMAFINAIAMFYTNWDKTDHRTRSVRFEKAMEKIYSDFTDDKEAAIFYALALTATADPADKSFKNQKKAGDILNALYPGQPNHPGIVHYTIHTYDSPELAAMALPAARKYAAVAPSSAHALHMPSHIFTRLGLWDECISSNLASVSSAQCYAAAAGISGHWDEEFHGLDYLVYAYLQKGQNDLAKKQWDYLTSINEINPANFKVAYAFAAIPSRYLLENKLWKEAAGLQFAAANFSWQNFPWQKAIIHFTRVLGAAHTGDFNSATNELNNLKTIYDTLINQKDGYKAAQVQIQIKTAEAWILFKEGKNTEALKLMQLAALMEDKTEKHPVTPGEVMPARELLGDMLLEMQQYNEAFTAYEANLQKRPNRFNGLYGAALAAEKNNNMAKAVYYYQQLISIAHTTSGRKELTAAKLFLKNRQQ